MSEGDDRSTKQPVDPTKLPVGREDIPRREGIILMLVARHGKDAAAMARNYAQASEAQGYHVAARAWRDIARTIERMRAP